MKKIVLKVFALFILPPVLFLLSCDLNPLPPQYNKPPFGQTPVERQYYTISLAPSNDVISIGTRALSKESAQMGCDFFEVVFKYNNGSTDGIVARAAWEIGNPSGLGGVYREGGVNYSNVTANPAPSTGSAVLFVGKKSDKTLLAVGKLSHVDGAADAMITSESKTVTFEAAALKAGVSYNAVNSSFLTYSDSSMSIPNVIESGVVHKKQFPLFKLAENGVTYAQYTFVAEGTAWGVFGNGIIQAGNGIFEKRIPRYSIANGVYQSSSRLLQDNKTAVTMTPNLATGNVEFTFNTANTDDGSVFALVFSVPVYALSGVSGAGNKAVTWYIRPGYESNWLDLDDGNGGKGGAVFIGTGDVGAYLN